MKLRTKTAIFMMAVLLTFVGFSLIASPSIEIMKVGKEAGYEIISNYLAKAETVSHHSNPTDGQESMRKEMMNTIIKIWEWLVIDFERVIFSISTGRLSLEAQPIPAF